MRFDIIDVGSFSVCYRPPSEGLGKVIVSVCSHFGRGVPDPALDGGVPDPALGGIPGLRFFGGECPRSQFFGGEGSWSQ